MEHTAREAPWDLSLRRTVIIHSSTIYIKKQANIWLEQATQIKASMGVSHEKKDVDDQSRSIRKKLDFMLIKTVRMSSYGYPNAL